jgi:uncharacterized protein (TIGR03437 family)
MREVSVLACLLFAMPLAAREVNQAMMVASAPSICDPSAPPVAKASFLSTDPQAILWFVVTGAIQSDMVVADFKTPTGATYPLTANWQPLATSGTYCFTSRTLQISGTDVATMTGTWSARVTINGIMYASVPFNIVANNCTYTLSTMLQTIGGGGTSSVDVTVVGSNCAAWTATTSTTWITIKSAASNLGTGTVTYSVAANPYAYSRSGVITIAGQSFTVSQSGACTFSLNPTSVSLGSGASGGTVNVTASFQNCAWTAVSNVYWITLQSVSGSGSGTVSYSVAANTGVPARNGTLTIAGQVFTVNQASGVCTYSLNPASQSFGSGGGSGSVAVTVTGSNCSPWAAVSNVDWIAVQGGASTTGSGSVPYSVAPNTGATSRTGTITIGGQLFTVTEAARPAGPQVLFSVMTRNNPATCDPNIPPAGETNFLSTDVQATLWFSVANIQSGDSAASDFYTPSGDKYSAASANWGQLSTAPSTCFWNARLRIAGSQPASMPGTWTARVSYNGQPLFTLAFNIGSNGPTILPGGVTSASGFGGMATIAPGTWIEIMGSNLATNTRSWTGDDFNGQNAPTSLDGVSVTVNSKKAFLSYISPVQVNALVPSDIGTGAMQIVVTNATGASAPYTITANAAQPGLLAPPAFLVGGRQYVAALLPDGQFAVPAGLIPGVASRPARPGEILVIYAIGFGDVTPTNIPAGTIVSSANSLTMPLEMTIGSASASIAWAGLSQGFVGLYQINVTVPDVPDSDAVPLTFTLNGVPGSTTVYTAVHR